MSNVFTLLIVLIPSCCFAFICYLQNQQIKRLIDILSVRNPESVVFDEQQGEKRTLKNPYKKRKALEEKRLREI